MFDQNASQPIDPAATDAPADTTFGGAFPADPVINDQPTADTTFVAPSVDATTTALPAADANDAVLPATDELLSIKQDALQQLSPLVGHLDQSPEEKFRTTMMMIQASDDQSLLKAAYETAKQINDEKVRAQALLDVVNEINYFTQHHAS